MNYKALHSNSPYNIDAWSDGYFAMDDHQVRVQPQGPRGPSLGLQTLCQDLLAQGYTLPLLIRFTDILKDRVQRLQAAFQQAIAQANTDTDYTAIYPIKVNQQRRVIEALQAAGGAHFGLEAGSKPELLAVISLCQHQKTVIICNGYKDVEYIRLALIAHQLGHQVYLIIEKYNELAIILEQAAALKVDPLLGVRIRLASIASGNWQNTGGEKAKFGLTSTQLLQLCQQLKQQNKSTYLQLLHVHMGSQIPNIRDIHLGIKETARYYTELWRLGFQIRAVNVGGGLGVDYEGARSRSACSMNYDLQEYANNVIHAFVEACAHSNYPMPHLMSESGRALTAHHAILISNTIDIETIRPVTPLTPIAPQSAQVLHELYQVIDTMASRSALESYHEVMHKLSEVRSLYLHGVLNLEDIATAEDYYRFACLQLKKLLQPTNKHHQALLDELDHSLADKLFVNFSLFQSLPDVWAIRQIFPILPLQGLAQGPIHRAIVQDLTCDSDGRVDDYVDTNGLESTLAIPKPNGETLLGFFLIGAYQEILGDHHNLFGRPNLIEINLQSEHNYTISHYQAGETVIDLLSSLGFSWDELLASFEQQLTTQSTLSTHEKDQRLAELSAGLTGYTYLED